MRETVGMRIVLPLLVSVAQMSPSAGDGTPTSSVACPPALRGLVRSYGLSCYQFNNSAVTWISARETCHGQGARLASVTSPVLQSWLSTTITNVWPDQEGVWIGLNDRERERTFVWDDYDGSSPGTSGYENWMNGYPFDIMGNQDCVYMRRSYSWRWEDARCKSANYFICEFRGIPIVVTRPTVSIMPSPRFSPVTSNGLLTSVGSSSQQLSNGNSSSKTMETLAPSSETADLVLPLSLSGGMIVLVSAIVVLLMLYRQKRRRRLKNTFAEADTSLNAQNPLYSLSGLELTEQQQVSSQATPNCRLSRPTSNLYTDIDVSTQETHQQLLSDGNDGPLYSTPFESLLESTAKHATSQDSAYPPPSYVDMASVPLELYVQSDAPEPETRVAARAEMAPEAGTTFAPQKPPHESPQDGYESFAPAWSLYENVLNPGS